MSGCQTVPDMVYGGPLNPIEEKFDLVPSVGYERCSMKKVLLNWSPEVCISDNAGSNAISKSVSATTHVSTLLLLLLPLLYLLFLFYASSSSSSSSFPSSSSFSPNNTTDKLMEMYFVCK